MTPIFTKLAAFTVLILTVVLATGCVGPVQTMSSHTLATSETTDQDVLWIRDGHNRPQRCTVENNAPVCRVAQQAQ